MNKKGAELPMNTLIVIILVVIVLIVVAVFFLGGTSNLSKSIRNIFYGSTVGTDVALARGICDNRCDTAQGLGIAGARATVYCRSGFDIDKNNDGKIDATKGETGVTCDEDPIKHVCNVRDDKGIAEPLTCP